MKLLALVLVLACRHDAAPAVTVDVPVLADVTGTQPLDAWPTAMRFAIDRHATWRQLVPASDAVYERGVDSFQLVVIARGEPRVVWISPFHPKPSRDIMVSLSIAATDTPARVRERAQHAHPTDVFVIGDDAMTLQTLAELIAAAGGDAHLGGGGLPRVEPAPN